MKRVGAFRFARATKSASVNTIIKASRHPTPLLTIDVHCPWTFISNLFSSHLRRIHKSHSFFYLPSGLLCVLTMAFLLEDPKDPCVKVLVSKGVMVKSLRGRAQVKEGSVIDCGALALPPVSFPGHGVTAVLAAMHSLHEVHPHHRAKARGAGPSRTRNAKPEAYKTQ